MDPHSSVTRGSALSLILLPAMLGCTALRSQVPSPSTRSPESVWGEPSMVDTGDGHRAEVATTRNGRVLSAIFTNVGITTAQHDPSLVAIKAVHLRFPISVPTS